MTARVDHAFGATPGRAFRALLWKELREGAAAAAIAMAVVGLGLYFSTEQNASAIAFEASSASISLFTLTSAGAALLIGYKQVTRDDRGDMWALLTHRPATRTQLFWGKAVAAALLYFGATAIPLAISLIWQATPGHRPVPFDIRMAAGDLVDLLGGFVYLLAAMLAAIREARWYASRWLPVGLAIACTTATLEVKEFAAALGVIALAIVVIATAARGAFAAGGTYVGQARPSRLALAISLALGLQIVGALALGILENALAVRTPEAAAFRSSRVVVTREGTLARVVREHRVFGASPSVDEVAEPSGQSQPGYAVSQISVLGGSSTVVQITDLSGRPLPGSDDSLARVDAHLAAGVVSSAPAPLDATYTPLGRGTGYRTIDGIFVPLVPTPFTADVVMTSWYFIRRVGLIAGYDNRSARQIGWLGPDGFTEGTTPPAVRFQGDLLPYTQFGYNQSLIAFPGAVFRLDLKNRRIQRVFTAQQGDPVLGAAASGDSVGASKLGPTAQFDVIATRESIYVQARDGERQLAVAHDPRAVGYGTATVTRALLAPEGGVPTFLWYKPGGGALSRAALDTARDQITKFDTSGARVAHFTVLPESETGLAARFRWAQVIGVGFFTPLASRIGSAVQARQAEGDRPLAEQPAGPRNVGWLSTFVGSIAAAIIALVVGRKYAFGTGEMWMWIAAALALGVLGLLLMASLRDWPARARCPSCGRERVVTRDRCEHCGSLFAPPAKDGTELIDEGLELAMR